MLGRDVQLETLASPLRPSPPSDPSARNPLIPETRLMAGPPPHLTEAVPRRVPPRCRYGEGRAAPGAWAYGVQPTLRPAAARRPPPAVCRRPALGEGGPDGEHLPVMWCEHSASSDVQERPNQETEQPRCQPPGSTPCPLSSNILDLAKPPGCPIFCMQAGDGTWGRTLE